MINLPGVLRAASAVEEICRKRSWAFCFIGGLPFSDGANRA